MAETFDLGRFVQAQAGVYERALGELRNGQKESHWMWFIFPQIAGLGMSPMSQRYAISGLQEARAYLSHPVVGERLRACCEAVLTSGAPNAQALMGGIDATKLRSSMTLFHRADPSDALFQQVLDKYFDGEEDEATLQRL